MILPSASAPLVALSTSSLTSTLSLSLAGAFESELAALSDAGDAVDPQDAQSFSAAGLFGRPARQPAALSSAPQKNCAETPSEFYTTNAADGHPGAASGPLEEQALLLQHGTAPAGENQSDAISGALSLQDALQPGSGQLPVMARISLGAEAKSETMYGRPLPLARATGSRYSVLVTGPISDPAVLVRVPELGEDAMHRLEDLIASEMRQAGISRYRLTVNGMPSPSSKEVHS